MFSREPITRNYDALMLLANSKKGKTLLNKFSKLYVKMAKANGYSAESKIQNDYDNSILYLGCKTKNLGYGSRFVSTAKLLDSILDYGVKITAQLILEEMVSVHGEYLTKKQNTHNLNKQIEKMTKDKNSLLHHWEKRVHEWNRVIKKRTV